jgi:predicted dinucleotide-binding enzyme
MKKIGVIGSGVVGQVLADGFLKHGYEVMRGTRDPAKLADWKGKAGPKGSTGTMAEAANFADLVVLAVKGSAALDVVKACGDGLTGKAVLDATNPIADDKPPVKGVLRFFTNLDESLMEKLQVAAPGAHFVKCFSSVGNVHMVNPDFGGTRPSMFICGDDAGAKEQTKKILDQFGWETEDMGAIEAARAIEPLCMLWCIPGMAGGKWNHAFHVLRK